MSQLSVRGEQSTQDEIDTLTNLADLEISASGKFLRKITATDFENGTPSGGGDVVGPSTSTDNAIARFNGTAGDTIQDSGVLISGSDAVTMPSTLDVTGNTTLQKLDVSSFSANLVTKTSDYSAQSSDHVILCDATTGSFTITLPVVEDVTGIIFHIKKTDNSGNAVTIDGNSSETIDGCSDITILSQYDSFQLVSDSSKWHVV